MRTLGLVPKSLKLSLLVSRRRSCRRWLRGYVLFFFRTFLGSAYQIYQVPHVLDTDGIPLKVNTTIKDARHQLKMNKKLQAMLSLAPTDDEEDEDEDEDEDEEGVDSLDYAAVLQDVRGCLCYYLVHLIVSLFPRRQARRPLKAIRCVHVLFGLYSGSLWGPPSAILKSSLFQSTITDNVSTVRAQTVQVQQPIRKVRHPLSLPRKRRLILVSRLQQRVRPCPSNLFIPGISTPVPPPSIQP